MRLPVIAVLATIALSSCAVDTWKEVASDAGDFVADQSLRLAADAVRSQVQPLFVDERISAAEVTDALRALDVISDFDVVDNDGDGFVDGNKIGVSLVGRTMCVDFSAGSGQITDGACVRT